MRIQKFFCRECRHQFRRNARTNRHPEEKRIAAMELLNRGEKQEYICFVLGICTATLRRWRFAIKGRNGKRV